MSLTIVQAKNYIGEGAAVSGLLNSAPTSGNLLIALVYSHHGSGTMDPVGTGWNDTYPHVGLPSTNYIWAISDTWGSQRCFYKWAGGGESTTQSPITAGSSVVWALTIYEISGMNDTWDNSFRILDAVAPAEDLGYLEIFSGPSDSHSMYWEAASDSAVLVLAQKVLFETQLYATVTGFANTVTGANAITSGGWPLGTGTKAGSVIGYYDTIAANGNKTLLVSNPPVLYGATGVVGIKADLSGGGAGLITITTTTIKPTVSTVKFRYTTIK